MQPESSHGSSAKVVRLLVPGLRGEGGTALVPPGGPPRHTARSRMRKKDMKSALIVLLTKHGRSMCLLRRAWKSRNSAIRLQPTPPAIAVKLLLAPNVSWPHAHIVHRVSTVKKPPVLCLHVTPPVAMKRWIVRGVYADCISSPTGEEKGVDCHYSADNLPLTDI